LISVLEQGTIHPTFLTGASEVKDLSMRVCVVAVLGLLGIQSLIFAADDTSARVEQVIAAAGGEEKLLKLFRYRERILITATPAAAVTPDEPGNRTSVVQIGGDVWLGTTKRGKDKVRVLMWAWSLRLLLDPKSKIESLPETTVAGKTVIGLRVTESISAPVTLYFDAQTLKLMAIDYTDTRHILSEWKTTPEGHRYASHVAGYRFTDAEKKTASDTQWYQTDILELTPLSELPAELK
jgi:hypothetical protein